MHPQRQMARAGQLQHFLFQHGIEFFEDDHIGQLLGEGRRRLGRERVGRAYGHETVAGHRNSGAGGLGLNKR